MFWIARFVVLFAAYCTERTVRKLEESSTSLVTSNASAPMATTPMSKKEREDEDGPVLVAGESPSTGGVA